MKEFDDLKSVWQQQPLHSMPDAEKILVHVNDARKQISRALRNAILQLIPAFLVVLLVVGFIKFESPLTYAGIAVILICILIYGYLIFKHYRGLTKDFSMLKPSEYLAEMEHQYEVRKKFNTTGSIAYMLMLFTGVILYLIEIANQLSPLVQVISYTVVTAWFLFVYFVLSKRVMKTENQKFENIISQLTELKRQFEEK